MNKISIKKFVEGYLNCATQKEKDKYIKDNLEIKQYVSFIFKDTLINQLLKITMFDKETGNVKVNSSAEYLLMTRIFVEQYTNLKVETEGFFEEYDELKKSGLFNLLLVGDDTNEPLIPYEEITEFKYLLSVKKNDVLQNKYDPHNFIAEQIDKFNTLGESIITPIVDAAKEKLNELSEEDLNKIVAFDKKDDYKEV